jgi:hypothetical protein
VVGIRQIICHLDSSGLDKTLLGPLFTVILLHEMQSNEDKTIFNLEEFSLVTLRWE